MRACESSSLSAESLPLQPLEDPTAVGPVLVGIPELVERVQSLPLAHERAPASRG